MIEPVRIETSQRQLVLVIPKEFVFLNSGSRLGITVVDYPVEMRPPWIHYISMLGWRVEGGGWRVEGGGWRVEMRPPWIHHTTMQG